MAPPVARPPFLDTFDAVKVNSEFALRRDGSSRSRSKTVGAVTTTIGLLALSLSFLMSGHYPPWESFESEATAALGGALVAVGALLVRGRRAFRISGLAALVLGLACVPWVQWSVGQILFLQDAVLSSGYLAGFATMIVAGETLSREDADFVGKLATAVGVAGVLSALIAIVQWLGASQNVLIDQVPSHSRPFANLGQPNHLATLLAAAFCATYSAHEHRRLSGGPTTLLCVLLGVGMAATQSRTGWLFVSAFVAWALAMHHKVEMQTQRWKIVLGAMLFGALVLAWGTVSDTLMLSANTLAQRATSTARWPIYVLLLDAVRQAPWVGYGWNQVSLAQQGVALGHPATHWWILNSHNIILDIALWAGIPMAAISTYILARWIWLRGVACVTVRQWSLLAGIGAVWLHAMLEFPLNYLYFLLPLGLAMGAVQASSPDTQDSGHAPAEIVTIAVIALTSLAIWITIDYIGVQARTTALRFELARFGKRHPPADLLSNTVLLNAESAHQRFWLADVHRLESEEDLDWQRNVVRRYAAAPGMMRWALIAALNGRQDESEHTLKLMCSMAKREACQGARSDWRALQKRYPELARIRFDEPP